MQDTPPPQPGETPTPSSSGVPSPESLGLGEVGPIPPALLIAVARREAALKATIKAQVDAALAEINDQLSTVRVSMQYLAFDNECLQREGKEKDARITALEQMAGMTVVFNLAQSLTQCRKMKKDWYMYWESVKESMNIPDLGIQAMIVRQRIFEKEDMTDCMLVIVRPGYRWKSASRRPMSRAQLSNVDNWEKAE